MERIEENIGNLFAGRPAMDSFPDVATDAATNFVPVTKRTICYIVGTVILDKDRILMVQEAKTSCFGSWYLPAGRVEPGETLVNAAKREVKEEAGYDCDIVSLISVEFGSGTWWRFNFAGKITGGRMKTLEEKDEESLQAGWFGVEEIHRRNFRLRARDILKVVDSAVHYRRRQETNQPLPRTLPVPTSHKLLLHRVILAAIPQPGEVCLLTCKTHVYHLPCVAMEPNCRTIQDSVSSVIKAAFGSAEGFNCHLRGLVGVEYNGVPSSAHDGLCLTTLHLMDLVEGRLPPPVKENYSWSTLSDPMILCEMSIRLHKGNSVSFVDLH